MRVVIAGLGSIGTRHLANIRALQPGATIVALRRTGPVTDLPVGADSVVASIDDAVALAPDVAFICGPTSTHASDAQRFLAAGAHVFIEKPIADDAEAARDLVAHAERLNRTLMVGYNLRFDPALCAVRAEIERGSIGRVMSARAEVGQYLPHWRPGADYRSSASARAALGGGVLLELSHELDYVRWLCGEIVDLHAFCGRLSDLDIDVEDTAEIVVRFASGALGSIHLDMTQHAATRTLRLVGTGGTLVWDAIAGTVRQFTAATGSWTQIGTAVRERNAMYLDEAAHFFACVRSGAPPRVTGRDALRTLELALCAGGRVPSAAAQR